MLKNLRKKLTDKQIRALGGFTYGIVLKDGYFFPLSGKFIPVKNLKKEKECTKS